MPLTPFEVPAVADLTPEQMTVHLRRNHTSCTTLGDHHAFHYAFDGLLPHIHEAETGKWASDFDASTRYPEVEATATCAVCGASSEAAAAGSCPCLSDATASDTL